MPSQAIGVDIGSHSVKVAVIQKKGGVSRATRLFRAPLGGDQDMVRIQGALKRAGISGGPGLLGISGRDLIIRYTHVPPVPDWRLKLLMQFEINEVSGQTGDDVAADYRMLDLPVEMDENTVLVALARNTWLSPRLAAATGSGIKAEGGCPNSVALFNAFLAHGSWKDGETTFLVNIGRENIDMAIQRDGELLFARNMSGGGTILTEAIMGTFGLKEAKAEKNKITKGDLTPRAQARYADSTTEKLANAMQGAAGQLVSMIQSSVMICRAQTKISDLNIDRLVLSGGTAHMKGIREYFADNMNAPVEVFDPAQECDLSQLNADDAAELGDISSDFAVAVGLAETLLAPTSFRLEVLTAKEKKKRHFAQRTIWALLAAAAGVVLAVLLFQSRGQDIEAVLANNEELETEYEQQAKVQKRQNEAVAKLEDSAKRDVAVRARRIPGAFYRAVMKALDENHGAPHIFLERIELETLKRSLDMDAQPSSDRASGDDDDRATNLHDQQIWPEMKVRGSVMPDAPNPGTTLQTYYTKLRGVVQAIRVEGFSVEMDEQSLDSRKGFQVTFRLKAPEKKAEES